MAIKEKMMEKKANLKSWIHDHKKGLIQGGVIAGVIAVAGGTLAAIVNRCGISDNGCSCESYEFYEVDLLPEDDLEECDICEETEEIKED